MLQTHPRNEPISRRPFLFPFLFLYFSLLLLSVLSYKYLIGVRFARKDATRRPLEKEREFFLSSISGGQNVPTWRTKREQLKDTLITPRPSCLLWCTRETIGPQGPKNSSTRSLAGEISFFFLLFSFFAWRGCSVIYLPRGATSTRFRRFETAHEIATSAGGLFNHDLAHRREIASSFESRGPKFGKRNEIFRKTFRLKRGKKSNFQPLIPKSMKFGEVHILLNEQIFFFRI